jgi:hypothetical protein
MPYVQHTKCVKPEDHSGLASGLIATAIAALVLLLSGVGLGAIGIVATSALLAYCRWWLYDRLVCLGGDRCAVGLLVATHPPSQKSGFDAFDTDYSIDLLLAPDFPRDCDIPVSETEPDQSNACLVQYLNGFQADLIKRQLSGPKFKFRGEYSDAPFMLNPSAKPKLVKVPILHAEFEGGGVWILYNAAIAALAVSAVGAVLCMIPIIGWIACLIAALIAAAIIGIAAAVALNDTGSPTDVNSELDELHSYVDVLLVRGTWVYDSAHEGWNEIHPIKHCQRVIDSGGGLTGWPADIKDRVERWCEAVGTAHSPLTQTEQEKPENKWEIHPVIDGCDPRDPNTPPDGGPVIH